MDSIKDLRLFLREKLESGEVTQNSLAKQLGITQATISRFSKGATGIDAEAAFKIMKFFDIQIQRYLIGWAGGGLVSRVKIVLSFAMLFINTCLTFYTYYHNL